MNSDALTKVHSILLIAVVALALLGGRAAYFLWNGPAPSTEVIRIGICADLDMNLWESRMARRNLGG